MWDALFAIDASLELVDMISIAMLLRIRWELVAADTNGAFTLLLNYPEPAEPPYTFIKDALYLRDHLDPQGGAEIISRYGKQAPTIELESTPTIRESSPSPVRSRQSRLNVGSPRRSISQQGAGIEALIQGAAKNVLERGSQWGVGKAIRDAVGEVKRNVEAYQSSVNSGQSTPRAGAREFRKPAQSLRPGFAQTPTSTARRVEELERRNKQLAKMLESAMGEMWEYHKKQTEILKSSQDAKGTESLQELSVAIAKVQFVQVYLEDASIPLPLDDVSPADPTASSEAASTPVGEALGTIESLSRAEPDPASAPAKPVTSARAPSSKHASPPSSPPPQTTSKPLKATSTLSPRSRPHLTSSNFSWMLGEDSASSSFAASTAHSTFSSDEKRRMKGKGFLFGDDDDEDVTKETETRRGSAGTPTNAKAGKNAKHKTVPQLEVEEEVIDLDNMGHKGVI